MSTHVDILATELVAAGVTHAFGVAGSGSSYALIGALGECGVVYQPVGHEAAAAMMAGAACRAGDVRAAAITIKGPGFANLVPGIVSNHYEQRPAITVSEAYAPDAPPSAQHKRMDHAGALAATAKGAAYAGGNPEPLRNVIELARTETPGPVHVELCAAAVDQPHRDFSAAAGDPVATGTVDAVLDRIASAKRPALLLGSVVTRRVSGVDWAAVGVPVATTAAAKGAIDETSPAAAGVATGERGELSPETAVLARADLIIGVGLRSREMVRSAPLPVPTVIVDVFGGAAHAGFDADMVAVVENLESATGRIVEALRAVAPWGGELVAARNAAIHKRLSDSWLPYAVFQSVTRHAPEAVLVLDTGLFSIVGECAWPARRPELFCGSSVGRFMGTGIPTALGISLVERRLVVAVIGDGGARPYLPELRIAATENLPLLVVVMADGRFGTIAQADPAGRLMDPALGTGDLSWEKLGEGFGLEAVVARSPEQADAAMASWAARPRPLLLEARFDPSAYVAMVGGLR